MALDVLIPLLSAKSFRDEPYILAPLRSQWLDTEYLEALLPPAGQWDHVLISFHLIHTK